MWVTLLWLPMLAELSFCFAVVVYSFFFHCLISKAAYHRQTLPHSMMNQIYKILSDLWRPSQKLGRPKKRKHFSLTSRRDQDSPELNKIFSKGKQHCKLWLLPHGAHAHLMWLTLVYKWQKAGPEFQPTQRAAITLRIDKHSTLCLKKFRTPVIFSNNSNKSGPILITFGRENRRW